MKELKQGEPNRKARKDESLPPPTPPPPPFLWIVHPYQFCLPPKVMLFFISFVLSYQIDSFIDCFGIETMRIIFGDKTRNFTL